MLKSIFLGKNQVGLLPHFFYSLQIILIQCQFVNDNLQKDKKKSSFLVSCQDGYFELHFIGVEQYFEDEIKNEGRLLFNYSLKYCMVAFFNYFSY